MEGWQGKSRWADRVRSNHSESRMHTDAASDRREKVIDKIKQVWEEKRWQTLTASMQGHQYSRTEFPTGWADSLMVVSGVRDFNISWLVENYALITCLHLHWRQIQLWTESSDIQLCQRQTCFLWPVCDVFISPKYDHILLWEIAIHALDCRMYHKKWHLSWIWKISIIKTCSYVNIWRNNTL